MDDLNPQTHSWRLFAHQTKMKKSERITFPSKSSLDSPYISSRGDQLLCILQLLTILLLPPFPDLVPLLYKTFFSPSSALVKLHTFPTLYSRLYLLLNVSEPIAQVNLH